MGRTVRCWSKLCWETWISTLDHARPNITTEPVLANDLLNDWLEGTLNQVLPKKYVQVNAGSNKAPWYMPHLRELNQTCKSAERSWRKDLSPSKKKLYRDTIREYKAEIKTAQTLYFSEKIASAVNSPHETFRIVKKLLSAPSPPVFQETSVACCDELADYFNNKILTICHSFPMALSAPSAGELKMWRSGYSLDTLPPLNSESFHKILLSVKSGSPQDPAPINILQSVVASVGSPIMETINVSLSSGVVPSLWKKAVVKALLKKANLDPDCFSNYRPISLLPGVSKIAERHVNQVLSSNWTVGISSICPKLGSDRVMEPKRPYWQWLRNPEAFLTMEVPWLCCC